jgi:glycogen phosphorylase/synthase
VTAPYTLFEVSWEVCNKVGGIHTVVSTKAKTLSTRFGDQYIAIGPWLLTGGQPDLPFEEDPGYADFCESCRTMGVPVRIGRWKIPGRPLTILVEFSGLFAKKDEILARLWEDYHVDSLFGEWDYVEPVLFGWAAGRVIEAWWQERIAPERQTAVAQFHEWMTGSGLLYLKRNAPSIGTVFTTHATILGRSIASGGKLPAEGLGSRTSQEAALAHNIRAKHSIEGVLVVESDVFTTVSDITAVEAELFFGRRANPLLPNGIDLDVIDEIAGPVLRPEAQARLRDLARRMLGEDIGDAALLCISGRYEFHNKGIDLLLEALARMSQNEGRRIVLFVLVPAGNSGLRSVVLERLKRPLDESDTPIGLSTHNLFDEERDPVQQRCRERGLDNARGKRVKVIQIPVYFTPAEAPLHLPYEAVLRAMELSCFPSFYEPWGYTPEESLAVGVPTLTTDCAGFGRFALEKQLEPDSGVLILLREKLGFDDATTRLVEMLETFLQEQRDPEAMVHVCRETARLTAWSDLVLRYYQAFDEANKLARARVPEGGSFKPKLPLVVVPPKDGQRPRLARFSVSATLPDLLKGLERLARNLWWSWDPEATELYRELSPVKWSACHHNPIVFLRELYPEDVEAKALDTAYCARLARVLERFERYVKAAPASIPLPYGAISPAQPVAYFCAEFGLHESLKIYSGGLGILAGDHLKSASDLMLPLIGVGLFYRMGYTRQKLTAGGDQISEAAENEPRDLPVELMLDEHGKPVSVVLQMPSSSVTLRVWKVLVGRVTLYLLDANCPENRPEDREITRQLYGGDHEMRLRQEIVLGRGGKRMLVRLGVNPCCFHINEGHAAFLVLERVSRLVREVGLTFDEAHEFVRATTIFTTHTPVPAGHDRFGEDLMRRYFADAPSWVGVPWERFYGLGQAADDKSSFNMTYLAMNFAAFVNGVSRLHGQVSQKLLRPFWPRLLESEVPVGSITNGVHLASWTHPKLRKLLRAEGRTVSGPDFSNHAQRIDGAALWAMREENKRALISVISERIEQSFFERGDSPLLLSKMLDGLEPQALWIGFARRFAPYKRAQLLFRDKKRLAGILNDPARPLRIIFAGKAHPNDKHGQEILKKVVEATRTPEFLGKIFFIEDYDIEFARSLVQGVDVWLNNPIRPLEASGTSGMKVAANGGLNLSVLDGWWIEAHDGQNGWSIGGGRVFPTQELQDELDGEHLYRLLEEEIAPLFFDGREAGVPTRWLERVRHNLITIPPQFNTDRMVAEYRDRAYVPLAAAWYMLHEERFAKTRQRSAHAAFVRKQFESVKILEAHMADVSALRVGDRIEVKLDVDLGQLSPEQVVVELVLGHTKNGDDLKSPLVVPLTSVKRTKGSGTTFEGTYVVERSGSFAYGIRVRPRITEPLDLSTRDLVLWL